MISLFSVTWRYVYVYIYENNIILHVYRYYFHSFVYSRVVKGLDDYCLDFVTFEWEYDIEHNICRYESCLPVTLLGIRGIQNELYTPSFPLGTSEVSLLLGAGDTHVDR